MDNNPILPQRKHPRLKRFDYSSPCAYFLTLCTEKRQCVFSHVVEKGGNVGLEYTVFGQIADQELSSLQEHYPSLFIDKYIIMPNHIHIILALQPQVSKDITMPTIMDIMRRYKSLTTKKCKQKGFDNKLFQTSFYEHIIRNSEDYERVKKYVLENPIQWQYDELYSER